MISRTYCQIAGKPISKDKEGRCLYCIRPTKKKYLCEEEMNWVSTCCSDGCYCSSICDPWLLSNGFCIFHSVIHNAHGYEQYSDAVIGYGMFGEEYTIMLEGRTFKSLMQEVGIHGNLLKDSKVENIAIIYDDTLKRAAHMHFVLREIFDTHLLPELYPSWVWST